MRQLTVLKIRKISLVGKPANKKFWLLRKSQDVAEITAALRDFFPSDEFDPDEISKSASKEELLESISMLKPFMEDFPDNVEDALSMLVKCAASGFMSGPEMKKEEESGPEDPFPSIRAPGEPVAIAIKKEDEDEEEEDEDEFLDPVERELHRINERLDEMEVEDSAEDPFPSIYIPIFNKIKKSERVPESVSKKMTGPRKTSIDGQENEITIEKEIDEDPWPSIFDATVFRSS